MTKVIALYTSLGLVTGEFVSESLDGDIVLKNPATIIPQPQTIAMVPMLPVVEEDSMTIKAKDIMSEPMTLKTDVLNHYNKMFGVGLTVVEKPSIIV